MRCASPSTMAVLPTPGSPMRTGLFFCPAAKDLDHALDFSFTTNERVQRAFAGSLR